jgi:hypothetical protein
MSLFGLAPAEVEALRDRMDRLTSEQAATLLAGLRAEALERCRTDGLFWLRFVQTRDEAEADSRRPFPTELAYVRQIWKVLEQDQLICIAKSRQMAISWLLCAFCVWFARFHPDKLVLWQTQKAEDADAMVCLPGVGETGHAGRMQFIERHLPSWMQMTPRETEGSLSYPNGSTILALAGGANQVRGKTPSLLVSDEAAYQEEFRAVWKAVAPTVQKAMKLVVVSTPNGTANLFCTLFHGYEFGLESA